MDLDSNDQSKPKANYDHGWNDPPIFSYDATTTAAQPGKRTNLLNKRVAFPMGPGGGRVTPSQVPSGGSDPPPSRPPGAPPCLPLSGGLPSSLPVAPPKSDSPAPTACGNLEAIEKGVDVLCQLVGTLPADDKREKEDIKKRLGVLRKMCEEDKLNANVYGRLVQLASALQSGDTATASNIQAGLMVDHVSLCSSWMAGVRLLVRLIADPDA